MGAAISGSAAFKKPYSECFVTGMSGKGKRCLANLICRLNSSAAGNKLFTHLRGAFHGDEHKKRKPDTI